MNCIWIELPAVDLARAKTFYGAVFGHEPTAVMPEDSRAISVISGQPTVSLTQTDGFVPTVQGSLPYFHVDGTMTEALERVSQAGGRVLEAAAARGDHGTFAQIADTEGNALYLHTAG